MTGQGALKLRPMGIDGPINSFIPFHSIYCSLGFLYCSNQGEPAYLSCDALWPVRKILLCCTAHHVAYHVEPKVCTVTTSMPCTRILHMMGEEKVFETTERDDQYTHPQQEAFSTQLISQSA